jgi:hypothetical protein
MTTSENSSGDPSILEVLNRHLERAKRQLNMPDLARGAVVMFTNGVRYQLARIYGKDAPALSMFPPVADTLPAGLVIPELSKRVDLLLQVMADLQGLARTSTTAKHVFIGHGRSLLWRELKDFITDRLSLPYDEFNRESVAGYPTAERLRTMLSQASFAFLIMTAEEEHADGNLHARSNVIHEVGLFQGQLGFHRAIVMLEHGCSEFSNIVGLTQIRFPRGDISARFEDVRRVLERERLLRK